MIAVRELPGISIMCLDAQFSHEKKVGLMEVETNGDLRSFDGVLGY